MAELGKKDKILQAIDELRRRKVRPDIERICALVFRRFGIVAKDTRMELEQLIDAESVIKVDYKGSISYRNAAKWSKYAMYKDRVDRGSTGILAIHGILTRAFGSLLVENPDYLDIGVPRVELERMMLLDDPLTDLTEIELILAKAMTCRFLVELSNGNYSLADHPVPSTPSPKSSSAEDASILSVQPGTFHDSNEVSINQNSPEIKTSVEDKKPKEESLTSTKASKSPSTSNVTASSSNAHPPNKSSPVDLSKMDAKIASLASVSTELGAIHVDGQRVGVRRKTAKKVFDPSDNYTPTHIRKRGRPPVSVNNTKKEVKQPSIKCCFCKSTNIPKGTAEKLFQCRGCTTRAHMNCILGKNSDKKKPQLNKWVCPVCKLCTVCFEPRQNETMLVCVDCEKSYHKKCHNPPIIEEQNGSRWSCASCIQKKITVNNPQPMKTKLIDKNFQKFIPKEETPDATNWTVDEVCKYLEDHGCAAQAAAFRHHEIDGRSLLMLKRHDVVYEMGIKAGPALKVYHFVQLLQVKDIKKVFPFNEMLR